jgi:CRISPR-associated protein Cas2
MPRHVLVCYDIREPRRLRRVHKVVRDFGRPLQYSVFACRLSAAQQADLEARLLEEIDQRVDQVMLVDLGPVDRTHSGVPGARVLGQASAAEIGATVVL